MYTAGHGYRNLEKDLPARNNTLFAVGSLSKMLSALAIVHLLNQKFPTWGEKILDTPVNQMAPNFKLVMSDRYRTEFITFRDMLSHRVCILDYPFALYALAGSSNKTDAVYQRRFAPETCHFRNIQVSYSNLMIHVAAEAAAAVLGNGSFEQNALAFFKTVGMTDLRFVNDADKYDEIPNMSQPYFYREGKLWPMNPELIKQVSAIPSSGGILTSANDMAQFIRLIINKGKVGEVQVVKEEVMDWIARVNTPYRFTGYRASSTGTIQGSLGYGVGIFVEIFDGYQRLGHSGKVQSYTSLVSILPALRAGIFTTASGPGTGPDHYALQEYIAEIMLRGIVPARALSGSNTTYEDAQLLDVDPQAEFDWKVPPILNGTLTPIETPAKPPPNHIRLNHSELVGHYGQVLQGEFDITDVNANTLYFSYSKWATGNLRQRTDTPAVYDLQLDSDLAQIYYSGAPNAAGPPAISIDFTTPNVAVLKYGTQDFRFVKGWSLGALPEIPWHEDSCGPTTPAAATTFGEKLEL